MSSYTEYTNTDDRKCVHALLQAVLTDGNTVSVFDGEEWAVKRSTSIRAIKNELAAAEEDYIHVRNSDGEKLGWFWLIYNNGSEGEPMVCITDYVANDYCDRIWNALNAKLG